MLDNINVYPDYTIEELEAMVSQMLEAWYMGEAVDMFDMVLKLRGMLQEEILRRDHYVPHG